MSLGSPKAPGSKWSSAAEADHRAFSGSQVSAQLGCSLNETLKSGVEIELRRDGVVGRGVGQGQLVEVARDVLRHQVPEILDQPPGKPISEVIPLSDRRAEFVWDGYCPTMA